MSKSICVFCGARMGNNPAFEQAARDLGNVLAKYTWRLVYGAGDIGLMGAVANGAQASGAATFGVMPEHLMQTEVGKRDLDRFIITDDMHSRKKLMFINSDAVVLLPGGAGSLDEFFEVLTWAQLGLHSRPIIVANIEVAWIVLTVPNAKLKPAWIVVPLELREPEAITVLAGTITLTPGTVSADLSDQGHSLLVHVLHTEDPDAVRDDITNRYQRRLKEIFS